MNFLQVFIQSIDNFNFLLQNSRERKYYEQTSQKLLNSLILKKKIHHNQAQVIYEFSLSLMQFFMLQGFSFKMQQKKVKKFAMRKFDKSVLKLKSFELFNNNNFKAGLKNS